MPRAVSLVTGLCAAVLVAALAPPAVGAAAGSQATSVRAMEQQAVQVSAQAQKPARAKHKRPVAGNPDGRAAVPAAAAAVDTSRPDHVVGNGKARSCRSKAVIRAVRAGGVITFDCGPKRVRIVMKRTIVVPHDVRHKLVVLDGGGKVTLSGAGQRRIVYMNTCQQPFSTRNCNDQSFPQLVLQNLTFVRGSAVGQPSLRGPRGRDIGGGGAVFVRGGQLKVVSSRFFRNTCEATGPDHGGAAIRVLSHSSAAPAYVVNSTFGGAPGLGGRCSNGGALSSIGVSWTILNSVFGYNEAIGRGKDKAAPFGGLGGAIYGDGDTYTMRIAGTRFVANYSREGVGAIFFVSNDKTGSLDVDRSVFRANSGPRLRPYPGIYCLARSCQVSGSSFA